MTEPHPGPQRLLRAITSVPGRILVSALLLALVARSIDWHQLATSLEEARWEFGLLAVLLGGASLVVGGLRWTVYLDALDLEVTPAQGVRAYFVGNFSNIALPTGFGGDAVRTWLVGRSGIRLARAAASVIFDRLGALVCLIALAWLGVAVDPDIPGDQVGLLALLSCAGLAAAALLAILLRTGNLGRLGRVLPARLHPWGREIFAAMGHILVSPSVQGVTLALGLVAQAAVVGAVWALGEMLSLSLSPAYLAVVSVLVVVATLLPISIAGFGVREGTFVALLAPVGIGAADAALLSVLTVVAMALASLPGAVALLVGRASVKPHLATEDDERTEDGDSREATPQSGADRIP